MELGYYLVDGEYGWDQEKFTDLIMKREAAGLLQPATAAYISADIMVKRNCIPLTLAM